MSSSELVGLGRRGYGLTMMSARRGGHRQNQKIWRREEAFSFRRPSQSFDRFGGIDIVPYRPNFFSVVDKLARQPTATAFPLSPVCVYLCSYTMLYGTLIGLIYSMCEQSKMQHHKTAAQTSILSSKESSPAPLHSHLIPL